MDQPLLGDGTVKLVLAQSTEVYHKLRFPGDAKTTVQDSWPASPNNGQRSGRCLAHNQQLHGDVPGQEIPVPTRCITVYLT
jgi:hypothetical protein